jgi:RNA polymerase sigma factor (sigma-70 family)
MMTAAALSLKAPAPRAPMRSEGATKVMGNESAAGGIELEEYYRQYGPMVLRRCRALLRHEEKAKDAMQDVFVQLLRNAHRLEHRAPSSLLYRIATNVCLNRLRSERRRPEDASEELLLRIAAVDDPEEKAGARAMLSRLFRHEKESTRTIAVLHLLDGFTLEEVAAEVGMSVSGVRKRLRMLRAQLDELEKV